MNKTVKSFYGIESGTKMIGGGQGDEIPTDGEKKIKKEIVVPDTNELDAEIQDKIMDGLYVEGDTAYTLYTFNQESADTYVDLLNETAEKLDGITNVYSLLAPNSAAIMLDDKKLSTLVGSNAGQAIDYYYNSYGEKVTPIEVYSTLREHNDEYIYFRTDHHWTSKGAYYVYKNYCKLKGFTPKKVKEFKKYEFGDYLGSYYATLQSEEMENHPDTVTAYGPTSTNDMVIDDGYGNLKDYNVIFDATHVGIGDKYMCYIGGNWPYGEIDNPKINDGTSCLVIKDSFGSSFLPYLVDHYDKVYFMDFRYTPYKVIDFCKENQVTDLIIENYLHMIPVISIVGRMREIME